MESSELVRLLGQWSVGGGPLYRQLAAALRAAIRRGEVEVGTRLPAERVFAEALAVSRSTVVAAYDVLREEGWIESRQGSGTRVLRGAAVGSTFRPEIYAERRARNTLADMVSAGPAEVIDLSRGSPAIPEGLDARDFALPQEELTRLLAGDAYQAHGSPALRRAIAERYTREGLPTNEAQVLITSGAQQAISLLATLYLQRGDSVLIENPTYVGATDAFRTAGARLVPVAVDGEGPRLDVLRGLAASTFPQLIYLVPTYQNPTGGVVPAGRRAELADVAADLGVPLVADDTLAELDLRERAPATLAAYATGGTVLTIGSLSKLFWGGLRIGWIRGPEAIVTRLARLRVVSDLGSTPLTQVIATRLMPRLDEVRAMRTRELLPRFEVLAEGLEELLPDWQWAPPVGGIFLWARIPGGDARELAQMALRYGVMVTPGTTLSVDESHSDYVRLAFLLDPRLIREGVERLARAWESYSSFGAGARRMVSVVV